MAKAPAPADRSRRARDGQTEAVGVHAQDLGRARVWLVAEHPGDQEHRVGVLVADVVETFGQVGCLLRREVDVDDR
ncbi:hypothetical protein A7K94_0202110 [Modestobacter sp. VKM Ac-2676]|nr:hypothetical protein A7K94_0202110 [Modestobacter sp. VKM Ac-2676]